MGVKNFRSNRAITLQVMRTSNRLAVLELLLRYGPISLSRITEKLPLGKTTIRRIVDDLTNDGWIKSIVSEEGGGNHKQNFLQINGADHCVIGIDLGGTKIFGAIIDLEGNILYEMYFQHHQTHSEESLSVVSGVINDLFKIAAERNLNVEGIGIGVPGVTDAKTGSVTLAPALSWQNFPLKTRLEERYSYPIVIENDVNLAALGEAWFGLDKSESNNLVLIAIGTGIGAGIILDGEIFHGMENMAGEIGYLVLARSQLGNSYPDFGAFEQIASGSGIAERARRLLTEQPLKGKQQPVSAEYVFAAARQQAAWAVDLIHETIDYLAQAVAAVQLMYDPAIILLGGGVARSADMIIDPVIQRLEGTIPVIPQLRVSKLGYRAAVLGAVVQWLRLKINTDIYPQR